jgi:uncharacterized protein YbbK (DUF523 family)
MNHCANDTIVQSILKSSIIDDQMKRPRVGISRCLIGDEVRYDGTHRLDERVVELLGPYVEWVPVCPEVEIGMGTPREPIHLVASADGVPSMHERVRLVGVASGEDWTNRMDEWARVRVRGLAALELSGYVFKARSPSCGIDHVAVHAVDGERDGRGLFAQALIDALPDLPVTDEASLADPAARAGFLERVLRHHGERSSG